MGILKMFLCNHNFKATKWNRGEYSYEKECVCDKCGRTINRGYKDRNNPRVDNLRFIIIIFIILLIFVIINKVIFN